MSKTKYWWKDDPEIGSYNFCYNEAGDYSFYINEVAVKFTYGWTEEERQYRFKGAKFIFGGCAGGVSYSNHILKAETVEEAKQEFEAWYEQYLSGSIKGLEIALAEAKAEHELFLLYKEEGREAAR